MDSYCLQVVRVKLDAVFSLLNFPLVLFLCLGVAGVCLGKVIGVLS